jgi:hypothetical protein
LILYYGTEGIILHKRKNAIENLKLQTFLNNTHVEEQNARNSIYNKSLKFSSGEHHFADTAILAHVSGQRCHIHHHIASTHAPENPISTDEYKMSPRCLCVGTKDCLEKSEVKTQASGAGGASDSQPVKVGQNTGGEDAVVMKGWQRPDTAHPTVAAQRSGLCFGRRGVYSTCTRPGGGGVRE